MSEPSEPEADTAVDPDNEAVAEPVIDAKVGSAFAFAVDNEAELEETTDADESVLGVVVGSDEDPVLALELDDPELVDEDTASELDRATVDEPTNASSLGAVVSGANDEESVLALVASSDPDESELDNEYDEGASVPGLEVNEPEDDRDKLKVSEPGADVAGDGGSVTPDPVDAELDVDEVSDPDCVEPDEDSTISTVVTGVSDSEFAFEAVELAGDTPGFEADTAFELNRDSVQGTGVKVAEGEALVDESNVDTDAEAEAESESLTQHQNPTLKLRLSQSWKESH